MLLLVSTLTLMMVAPFTGAWIEMLLLVSTLTLMMVAPFTGAWIEIPCQT